MEVPVSEQILFNPVTGESMTVLESTAERFKARYALKPRGSIAGSVITMHDAFLRMSSLGFSYDEAAKMASGNPARLLGVEDLRGSIDVGKRADLVGLAEDGAIQFVMIGGEFVKL